MVALILDSSVATLDVGAMDEVEMELGVSMEEAKGLLTLGRQCESLLFLRTHFHLTSARQYVYYGR